MAHCAPTVLLAALIQSLDERQEMNNNPQYANLLDVPTERWWLLIQWMLAIIGVALFGWFWWLGVPALYRSAGGGSENAQLAAVTTTRAALLAGLVGVGALGTFWLNSRMFRITARTFEITARTFEMTEQGQLTDRFSKAIEHLGSDKIEVRLGGIFALERIAVDSKRDHPTIVEVLSAFIRQRSDLQRTVSDSNLSPADVQAAFIVIGRLPHLKGVRRDLQGAILSDTKLVEGADLSGTDLGGADLSETRLVSSDLSGANLLSADLSGAWLDKTDLSGAEFDEAELSGACLQDANLSGADLSRAVGLTQEQVDDASGNAMTQLPDGMRRPSAWVGR